MCAEQLPTGPNMNEIEQARAKTYQNLRITRLFRNGDTTWSAIAKGGIPIVDFDIF